MAASLGAHLALVAALGTARAPEMISPPSLRSTAVRLAAPSRAVPPRPAPSGAAHPAAARARTFSAPPVRPAALPEPEPPPESEALRLPVLALPEPQIAVPPAPPGFGAFAAAAPGSGAAGSAPAPLGPPPGARGAFGAARAAVRVAAAPEPLPARRRPAAILFKPRPRYTAAALEQKIEGEVWLEVLFPAAGAARVLRLLRGLGFGLDEAAAACVAELRFRPAEEDGHPVDSAAVVRLRFELAEAAPSRPVSANTAERRAP